MSKMNVGKFERLCRRAGLAPIARAEHRAGTIFIAEGLVPFDPIENVMGHFCVIWAVQHSGADIAQRFPASIGSSQQERIAEATRQATAFLDAWHAPLNGASVAA